MTLTNYQGHPGGVDYNLTDQNVPHFYDIVCLLTGLHSLTFYSNIRDNSDKSFRGVMTDHQNGAMENEKTKELGEK
jgi:hypothetical protein